MSKEPKGTIIRVRLPLLLLLLAGLLVSFVLSWVAETRFQLREITHRTSNTKEVFVRRIVELDAQPSRSFVLDCSYWDGLIRFLKSGDRAWAKDNLIPSLEGLHADGLWLFRKDKTTALREFHRDTCPITVDFPTLLPFLNRGQVTQWYTKVDTDLWEFTGTTIHRSDDVEHKGEFFGYLVLGRRLDPLRLHRLETLTECRLSLLAQTHPYPEGTVALDIPLRSITGAPIAYLHAEHPNQLLSLIGESINRGIVLISGFALFACLLLGYFLLHWIGKPLRHLSLALESRSPLPLHPLLQEKTEFGDLARLTHAFFQQKQVLVEAHDELEKRVVERTQALSYQAYHDSLTQLPNRLHFRESLERALQSPLALAVLFMDIDDFKVINDSLGHEVGDQILCATAQRITQEVRTHDIVARLGGDEFALLLEGRTELREVWQVAERLQAAFQEPVFVQDRALFVKLSIGIALREGTERVSDLLRNADTAMYAAKASGKAGIALFDQTMKLQVDERLELEADLRRALSQGGAELCVAYQPLFELSCGQSRELEALVRWNHPTRGLISPGHFIPLAEEAGLIQALGEHVLTQACTTVAAWSQRFGVELTLNVNLSARQLREPSLIPQVLATLQQTGLAPHQLALEVTESAMMQYPELSAERLSHLRTEGIRIAIDDFGTGYSSMSVLAQLPLDTIKIDRSFVSRLGQSEQADAIIRAIIDLARAMHLRVVSEGIETRAQWDQLHALGSRYGQGYYFSPPLSKEAMTAFLEAHLAPATQQKAA